MEATFWHKRWQRQEIGFHRDEVHPFLIRFIPDLQLAAGATILVPLCGKSLDLLWLCEQGYRVIGVELSQLAVEEFCAENRLPVKISATGPFQCYQLDQLTIYCGDYFALRVEQLGRVDAVYDRASLVALPVPMRSNYAAQLLKLLPSGGQLLTIAYQYPQEQMAGPPFSVPESELVELFGAACSVEKLHSESALGMHSKMRAAGLRQLHEEVYRLRCV